MQLIIFGQYSKGYRQKTIMDFFFVRWTSFQCIAGLMITSMVMLCISKVLGLEIYATVGSYIYVYVYVAQYSWVIGSEDM